MVRLWIAALFLLLASTVFAQLYKSVDENGNVVYSDVPPDGTAEPVELPPLNVIEAVKVAPPRSESADPGLPLTYSIQITQPQNEQTFRNTREFPVSVSIDPPLQEGHQVAISLDGVVRVLDGRNAQSAAPQLREFVGRVLTHAATVRFSRTERGAAACERWPSIPNGMSARRLEFTIRRGSESAGSPISATSSIC